MVIFIMAIIALVALFMFFEILSLRQGMNIRTQDIHEMNLRLDQLQHQARMLQNKVKSMEEYQDYRSNRENGFDS